MYRTLRNNFSPNGNDIAIAHDVTPFITVYPWSSGFGTKYSNPAILPTGNADDVEYSINGDTIAVTHANSPQITAYPWSVSGFGTKYANPVGLSSVDGVGLDFM